MIPHSIRPLLLAALSASAACVPAGSDSPLDIEAASTARELQSTTCAAYCTTERATRVLTFDAAHDGTLIQPGAELTDVYDDEDLGLHIRTTALDGSAPLAPMAYDSSQPRVDERSLGTPNEELSGPGEGVAGSLTGINPNTEPLGLVLVRPDPLSIGDDEVNPLPVDRSGARIRFDVTSTHAEEWCLDSVRMLDTGDDLAPEVLAYQDDGRGTDVLFYTQTVPATGDNGVNDASLGALPPGEGDWRIDVELPSGGALDSVTFCTPVPDQGGSDTDEPTDTGDPGDTDDNDNRGDDGHDNRGDDSDSDDDDDLAGTLDLRVEGGGGCDSWSAAPAGMTLLGGLLIVGMRRRRRPESGTAATLLTGLVVTGLTTAGLLAASPALAQDSNATLDLQRFDPVPQTDGPVTVFDPELPRQGTFSIGGAVNYAYIPLQLADSDGDRVVGLVDHLAGADLLATYALTDRIQVGVDMPFLQVQSNTPTAKALGHSGGNVGIGDLAITQSFMLVDPVKRGVGFGVMPKLTLPTGTQEQWVGAGAVRFGTDASLSKDFRAARVIVSGGFHLRDQTVPLATVDPSHTVRGAVALTLPVQASEFGFEFRAATALGDTQYEGMRETPMQLLVTFRPNTGRNVRTAFGGGRGLTPGFGAPAARAFGLVQYVHEPEVEIEPPKDTDGDGYLDPVDQCPLLPEDFDLFEDGDGCPDLDNDDDGIIDANDTCPYTAGDFGEDCPVYLPETDEEPTERIVVTDTRVILPEDIHFEFDKSRILPRSEVYLDAVVEIMQSRTDKHLVLEGHTDAIGSRAYNRGLSRRRANSVRNYLIENGLDADRISTRTFGETDPIATNNDRLGRSLNRRVEFVLRPAKNR